MRSDAKASTAGSTKRQATKPGLLLCVLAAAVALLALVVGSASASKTHLFKEVFGSIAQPSFSADRGLAVEQSTERLLVIDAGAGTLNRYFPNGTAANFSALGSNSINGKEGVDTTPQNGLSFGERKLVQVAVDESGTATDGNIYLTQHLSDVVDVFASNGTYIGQLSESTTGGPFGEPCGVAVDENGNVYVGDRGDDEIHVYEPVANPPVNADNSANFAFVDPCTMAAGTGPTAGFLFVDNFAGELFKVDATTGESKYLIASGGSTVSVDPGTGHVYAARNTGTSSEVSKYDASGALSATLLSSFKPGSTAEGVAVNEGTQNVYVARSGNANVQVYGPTVTLPDVVTTAATNNSGTKATLNGTVNPDGVELSECKFEYGKTTSYGSTAPCAESPAVIGSGTSPVAVHADISGLQPNGITYQFRLVAKNPTNPAVNGSNLSFTTPNTVITTAASGITPTTATLNGTVNPDGVAMTECLFEWGETTAYGNAAPCVPSAAGIGTGTSPVAVSAALSGLHPGTPYHYRLKTANTNGQILGTDMTVQTTGPRIAATWAEDVVFTEAILKAEIDPEGNATTYHFEYGTTEAYGQETPELPVGSDSSVHQVTRFLEGLQPGTTYHYRVIATNGVATNEGPDLTFTTFEPFTADTDCPNQTFRDGASANLPDCRAYEMVSPLDKNTADVLPQVEALGNDLSSDQAALDGDKMAYGTAKPFGDAAANLFSGAQYIATRTSTGWSTHGITPAHEFNVQNITTINEKPGRFSAFSEDLSTGFLYDDAKPPLTVDAVLGSANFYLRDNASETYTALTTQKLSGQILLGGMGFQGYSGDGSHTLFAAKAQLTPDAKPGEALQLYDYHDGELELVSVLPNGEPTSDNSGAGQADQSTVNAELGETRNAISEDGSRIFWMTEFGPGIHNIGKIYARIEGETTVPVSGSVTSAPNASYWSASGDGSTVVFSAGNSLYRFNVDTETPSLIASEVSPQHGVLGASEDVSHVYFLSKEVLDVGAIAGAPNLYLDHEGVKSFIATLANGDESGSGPTATNGSGFGDTITQDFSQVTPGGRHVIFNSRASLTDYDNTSLDTGEAAIEVYRYDADTEQLTCISCNPSGQRPETSRLPQPHRSFGNSTINVQAAAWLPTPRRGTYTPRMVSDDGNRVLFNALDALLPQDTNGVQDVYQWEEQGTGSCQEAGGCVSLISTGTSHKESTFVDASEGGGDVFFRTNSSIDPEDPGLVDIYDARIGGGFPRPVSPPPCIGDACQSVPSAPNDPTPASASFRGAGDPLPQPNCAATAKRAAKLGRKARQARRNGLDRRATRLAKQAKRLSRSATRCRRANRGVGR